MDYNQLSKFFAGELTPEEKKTLLASFHADEEQLDEAAKLKNSWVAAQLTYAPADREIAQEGWEKFRANINRQKYRYLSWWRVAAAAVLTGVIFAASFYAGYSVRKAEPMVTAYHTLSIPAGQYAQLTLSDGSEIWLNSRSKLVYPERFTSATREIQLEGEGLFKVASNKKQPFVVKTETMDVIATGTQFNVLAYPDDNAVAITLIEGVVKLNSNANGIDYQTKIGQLTVYDKSKNHISAQDINTDTQISWIYGEYQFKETTLEEITRRLERIYNVVFVFQNEALKQKQFTGTFYNHQSIETILQLIMTSGKMQYTIERDTVYIK